VRERGRRRRRKSTSYSDEEDLGDPDSTMISHSHGVRERDFSDLCEGFA